MNEVKKTFTRGAKKFIAAAIALGIMCAGVFSACGDGHEHSLEKVSGIPSTCIQEGRAAYWKCKDCGAAFSDADGENPVDDGQLALALAPHGYKLRAAVAEGSYYVGEYVTEDMLTYSLRCVNCDEEEPLEGNVTIDLERPLTQGANNFVVSYGDYNTVFTVRAKPESEKVATLTVTTDKIFHSGQTVVPADFTATYQVDDRPAETATDFTVKNPKITADTQEIEISYKGKTAKTSVTVHAVTHELQVDSTAETEGTIEHYYCETCEKNFDAGFNEIDNVKMPRMQTFAVTDNKIVITKADGSKAALKTESGHTFLGGDNNGWGRLFMKYNVSVDSDTDIKFYLSTCMRTGEIKISDVYSIKINGIEMDCGENLLPRGAENNWFSKDYSFAGEGRLLAGQNNLVEVTRLNLIDKERGGDKAYNFFGIGISAMTETAITLNEPCSHICPHCGKCTESITTSSACLEKCAGHDGEHFCGHICNICGECKDSACTDAVCSAKCGCKEFTVMHNSVTAVDKNGATVNKNTASNEQNISANDSSAKKGLIKITYNIRSDAECTVKLYIKTSSQTIENTLAESFSFKVGGQPVTVDGNVKMPWNEANKWKDLRYTCVGEIKLAAGENVIEIIRHDMTDRELNDYTGYNFFGIALSGNLSLDWAQA